MYFLSKSAFDSVGEETFWNALKRACSMEPGFCWRKYPVTNLYGNSIEPDVVLLHPSLGLCIIEVKGCKITDIESIEGHVWYMIDSWYESEMEPLEQVRNYMFALTDRMKQFRHGILREESGECKVFHKPYIALPFITEQEWKQRFSAHVSAPMNSVIFSTDLTAPDKLWSCLVANRKVEMNLPQDEWDAAVAMLTGSEGIQNKPRRPAKNPDSRANLLRKVEEQLSSLDIQQHQFAIQIPSGPQRLRGLAGTGKTVVLAQKAASMHVNHPEWNIVFSFYTRSLYGQVRELIIKFTQQFSEGKILEPNWEKVHILHGWGAKAQPGLYRTVCELLKLPFRTYTDASTYFGTQSAVKALDSACQELLDESIPELYDAIFIDEGQDFGSSYYRLCYHLLKQPKRIIWGYDEIQSLEALEIPTAETLFGRDADNNPLVDLDGSYPGDIEKDQILYHCYRNPRPVLVAAHTFGLGLLRRGGAIQFIDTVGGWQDIGYEIQGATDNKLKAGERVTLIRPEENSPHHLEKLAGYKSLVTHRVFTNKDEECSWIAEDIARQVTEEELRPEEIAIITLDARKKFVDNELALFQNELTKRGLRIFNTARTLDVFRQEHHISFANVFRAKGNEASLVYVYGFERTSGQSDVDIVKRRNTAFTAMTRTKGWLVLTGVGNAAAELFEEVDAALAQIGSVSFIVPDVNNIQRNLETYENHRRREKNKKAEKSMYQLIKDLSDVDPGDLSEEQKKVLYRLLFGKNMGNT